jgi:hypothetical protein
MMEAVPSVQCSSLRIYKECFTFLFYPRRLCGILDVNFFKGVTST